MDPVALLLWDRHVVTCACCRAAVAQERRVLMALRAPAAPAVPGDLRGMLLALAEESAAERPRGASRASTASSGSSRTPDRAQRGHRDGPALPPVPVAPIPVVDRGMPALHRSARRATVFAGLAAGATAAAAWGVAVTAVGLPVHDPGTTPGVLRGTPPVTSPFVPAAFMVANLGGGSAPPQTVVRPAVGGIRLRSAQSTP
jgi:hypothetical protein